MDLLITRISFVNRNTSIFGSSGSYLMESPRGILEVSSSPLEELTGSSWHLCYCTYAQCAQKGSGNMTALLQWSLKMYQVVSVTD